MNAYLLNSTSRFTLEHRSDDEQKIKKTKGLTENYSDSTKKTSFV
jgi:hypothetical protein